MNRTTRQAAAARARGLDRLRAMTIGTAMAGFAGVAGFGAIAAISNSGSPVTVAAAAGDNAGNGSTDQTTTTTTTTPTTTTPTTTTPLTAAPTPTPTHHRAHVTTGGSG
jgi:cell division septation protein DedD